MSNQLQITGDTKVKSLEGVLTGTSGLVGSVPLGAANGVATLDSGGKVPVSQLPSSVVTYLGTWNAATNTPTLVNGVGDAGDMYICNVAGTVNFGAGPVTFAVGDWVLYGSGTWQKSNGQNGTVTSVGASITGNAIGLTGSPITTAGTLAFAFSGTSGQYVNGAGNLTTFPTLITSIGLSMPSAFSVANSPLTANGSINVTGAGTSSQYIDGTGALQTFPALTGYVPYTGATTDVDLGIHVLNAQALHVKGTAGAGHLGLKHQTATPAGSANESLIFADVNGNLGWQNDNLYLTTLVSNANTANRSYTFPNASGTLALTSDISYPVTSVFGRTGVVTAQSGDYTTTLVTEGTNLYYTDARARAALSFTAGSGAYNSTTGVITIPTNTNQLTNGANFITLASLSAGTGISYNNTTGVITSTITQYTDALARAAISLTTIGTSGAATYNSTTGVLNIPQYIGGVTSVFGRTGAVVATEGDYTLTQLGDVTITTPTTGQVLKYNGTIWINDTDANTGTVTSVGLSAPTGFSVSGSPVTSSGTLALAFAAGYSLPTTASQTNWDTAYTNRITSLTTTGSSGAATLVSNTLNVPNYTLAGLGGQPLATNLTSLAGLSYVSTSFVKMTAAGTFSLDTNTYLTTSSAASTYLPLTGGILTGALGGTIATFNGLGINATPSSNGTAASYLRFLNTGADFYIGIESSTAGGFFTGSSAYASVFYTTTALQFIIGGTKRLDIGITGAAIFSSSVTASSFVKTSGTSSQFLKADGSVDSTSYQGALTLTTTGTSGAATLVGNTLNIPQYSGGGGSISLAAIGSTPNANGATLTGSVLNLEPASSSFGGVVTTGTQTFAGAKTFTSSITANYGTFYNTSLNNQLAIGYDSSFNYTLGRTNVDGALVFYGSQSGSIAFSFSGADGERVRINSSGNMGIGTATIGSKLQVNGGLAVGYSASTAAPTNGLSVNGQSTFGTNTFTNTFNASFGTISIQSYSVNNAWFGDNVYYDGTNFVRRSIGYAGLFYFQGNEGQFRFGATGAAAGSIGTGIVTLKTNLDNTFAVGNLSTSSGVYTGANFIVNSSGSVGIGTITIGSTLQVNGNAAIGYSASTAAPTNGLAVSGFVGIGVSSAQNALDVVRGTAGAMARSNYETASFSYNNDAKVGVYTSSALSTDGASLLFGQTNLQASSTYPGFELQYQYSSTVANNHMRINYVGRNASGVNTTSTGNLFVVSQGGRVGINLAQANIGSSFQVNGNAAIGYSASTAAPTNGLVVAGNMGIGMTTISGSFSNGNGVQFLPAGYLQVQTTSSNPLAIGRNTTTGVMQSFVYGTTTTNGTQIGAIGTDGTGLFLLGGNGSTAQLTLTSGGQVTLATGSNVSAIAQTGYSLTGANAQSLLDLAGTWNTTGNPTAIKLNITNTASGATSNLMDLQVGGVSKFKVDKAGSVTTAGFGSTTAQPWKLGQLVTATVTGINLTGYITIEVNGTQYNLALANLA